MKSTWRFVLRACQLCTALLALQHVAVAESATHPIQPFEFAVLGDPQVGYGPGGIWADSARFDQVIAHVNQAQFPLTVIPGDLVQSRSLWQRLAFDRSLAKLQGQVLLTPGNHDVVSVGTLSDYRERHGRDYQRQRVSGVTFITINSETARSPELSTSEYAAQWEWLEKECAQQTGRADGPVFFVTHRPPFIEEEDEAEGEVNWPKATRKRLLELARTCGARWILSGHAHRTLTARTADGIQILVLPGTARSFDQSPIGYSRFTISGERVQHRFEPLSPAPSPPPSIPGLRSWTPRILDFSVRHWLFTLGYLATAVLAYLLPKRAKLDAAELSSWRVIAVLMAFYGLNMQLDFDELLSAVGRGFAKLTGLYGIRHAITGAALVFLVAGMGALFLKHRRRAGSRTLTTVAWLGLVCPTLWFCLSAASNHVVGMLFDEAYWDLLNLGSMALTVGCSLRLSRAPQS